MPHVAKARSRGMCCTSPTRSRWCVSWTSASRKHRRRRRADGRYERWGTGSHV